MAGSLWSISKITKVTPSQKIIFLKILIVNSRYYVFAKSKKQFIFLFQIRFGFLNPFKNFYEIWILNSWTARTTISNFSTCCFAPCFPNLVKLRNDRFICALIIISASIFEWKLTIRWSCSSWSSYNCRTSWKNVWLWLVQFSFFSWRICKIPNNYHQRPLCHIFLVFFNSIIQNFSDHRVILQKSYSANYLLMQYIYGFENFAIFFKLQKLMFKHLKKSDKIKEFAL